MINIADLPWSAASSIEVGDYVMGYGRFRQTAVSPMSFFSLFEYPHYLRRLGYTSYSVSTAEISEHRAARADRGWQCDLYFNYLRDRITQSLFEGREKSEAVSVLAAVVLGEKGQLANHTSSLFRSLGLSHVLVISGFHVALVYGVLRFLARRIWTCRETLVLLCSARIPCDSVAVLGAFIYVGMSGFTVTAVRALIVLLFSYFASLLARQMSVFNSLILCFIVLSMIWPLSFLNIGFQLSFSALIGLCFASALLGRCGKKKKGSPLANLWRYIRHSYVFSYCAWAATAPLVWIWFGDVSLLSPLWNLVFVPAFCGIFIIIGIPLTIMFQISPVVCEPSLELLMGLGGQLLYLMSLASSLTRIIEAEVGFLLVLAQTLLLVLLLRWEFST
jgi:competence protein ComEC